MNEVMKDEWTCLLIEIQIECMNLNGRKRNPSADEKRKRRKSINNSNITVTFCLLFIMYDNFFHANRLEFHLFFNRKAGDDATGEKRNFTPLTNLGCESENCTVGNDFKHTGGGTNLKTVRLVMTSSTLVV